MKLLLLVAAAISLSHAFSTPFIGPDRYHKNSLTPRAGKGSNSALIEKPGSSRGGPSRKEIPAGRKPQTKEDVEQVKQKLEENKKQEYTHGKKYEKSVTPEPEESRYTYDSETNIGEFYAGAETKVPADQMNYHHVHDPSKKDKLFVPRPNTEEGKKATTAQRRKSQRGLPKEKNTVLDEKNMGGLEPDSSGSDGATIFVDTAKSQNKEGIIASQLFKKVRAGGENPDGTWSGKGGVRIIPNTKPSYERPLVGWNNVPGYPDPKYAMEDSRSSTAQGKRRHVSSDSGSGSGSSSPGKGSSTLVSKKAGKKAQKPGRKIKRGGVEQIAAPGAAVPASGSASNDPTGGSQNDLQFYLEAFDIIQSNATEILWPFLDDMIQDSNSSEVYMAAWSIYSQLLRKPYKVVGSFYYGLTSFDWEEEQWRADPNISNETLLEFYAQNDILLDLYDTAWNGGLAALNASGTLDNLEWLGNVIDTYDDSALPAQWTMADISASDPFADSLVAFLETTIPDFQIDIPDTASSYAMISGTALPSAAYPKAWSTGAPFPNYTETDSSPSDFVGSNARPSGILPSSV